LIFEALPAANKGHSYINITCSYTDFINNLIRISQTIKNCHFYQVTKDGLHSNLIIVTQETKFGLTFSPSLNIASKKVKKMFNFNGNVTDLSGIGETNPATLTFDDLSQQGGQLKNGRMQYYGLYFTLTGSYTAKTSRSFNLQAKAKASDGDEYGHGDSSLTINLTSKDGNDNKLDGTVKVLAGGPNVGKTYKINFARG
jgi:hypothetical protein